MQKSFQNVFTLEDIAYLKQLPAVLEAKSQLNTNALYDKVSFTVPVTDSIRDTLRRRLGLDLSHVQDIPMRWIKGDTLPHTDTHGEVKFERTYLVFLNNSPGEWIIDNKTYHSMVENTGYVFSEEFLHKTTNTGTEPRLLLGPMSEQGFSVGLPSLTLTYYASYTDAQVGLTQNYNGGSNPIQYPPAIASNSVSTYPWICGTFDFGSLNGYTTWRAIDASTGALLPTAYYNGDTLPFNSPGTYGQGYYLFPNTPCFLEGTQILCQVVEGQDAYVAVEQLKKGDLVKTSRDGYKKVALIGKGTIQNPGNDERIQDRLYRCSPAKYPELKTDLFITGCHSILVDSLTEREGEDILKQQGGKIFVTDKKYRLMACIDARAEPWIKEGTFPIWHLALEHADIKMNYGVFANGGLLVETCSINSMRNNSNMEIIS